MTDKPPFTMSPQECARVLAACKLALETMAEDASDRPYYEALSDRLIGHIGGSLTPEVLARLGYGPKKAKPSGGAS